jgi:hypothetical protein
LSLILEALKKLDREKKAPERGFLVVGAVPWPAARQRRWLSPLFVAAAGAALGSALWLAWRARGHDEPRRLVTPVKAAAPNAAATPMAATPTILPPPVESHARGPEALPAAERAVGTGRTAGSAPASAEPGAALQLQAITQRDGRPVAVLSNRLVHEGDHFDGVTVVHIGADEVEIEAQGRRRTLRF